MRFFSTAGPVRPDEHYTIPPLDRVELCDLLSLIQDKQYFVLHAPRQTGKTSALIALRDHLNSGAAGSFRCVNVNVEPAQVARDDVAEGIRAVMGSIAECAAEVGDDYPDRVWPDVLDRMGPQMALRGLLSRWCMADPTPLVLLVDEIDSLVGDTLLSVLRQLRAGYERRPEGFPQSVVLCGLRDIRDYRIRSTSGEVIAGGSPFNVAAESLRLGDFTKAETYALMKQHTAETKQPFEEAALAEVWEQTQGQPWLVNALCAEACFKRPEGRDRTRPIRKADIHAAKEALVVSRRTHLDQLAHKLEEERVRRVVVPILSGGAARHEVRDLEYVRDLGLVDASQPPRIANPIYAEVVPRELGYVVESGLDERAAWYVDDAGRLDMGKLLRAFATFYGEHAEHWLGAARGLQRGGAAANPAGVPAAHRERRRAHRARVRDWPRRGGHPSAVASGGRPAFGPVDAHRGGVQGAEGEQPPKFGEHHRARGCPDAALHGAVQRRGRAPSGFRPARGTALWRCPGADDQRTRRPERRRLAPVVQTTTGKGSPLPALPTTP